MEQIYYTTEMTEVRGDDGAIVTVLVYLVKTTITTMDVPGAVDKVRTDTTRSVVGTIDYTA